MYFFPPFPRISSLKNAAPDLISLGLRGLGDSVKDESAEEARKPQQLPLVIPTSDRPMSFVQELEESESGPEEEEAAVKPSEAPKVEEIKTKTTIKSTTVVKMPRQSNSSSCSISEEEFRKEFPNMPRQK